MLTESALGRELGSWCTIPSTNPRPVLPTEYQRTGSITSVDRVHGFSG